MTQTRIDQFYKVTSNSGRQHGILKNNIAKLPTLRDFIVDNIVS